MTNQPWPFADVFSRKLPSQRLNIQGPKRSNFSGSGGIGAILVDCEHVRKRKAEVQACSPADLGEILGLNALDESLASIPLKELQHSHSRLAFVDAESPNSAATAALPEKPPKKRGGRKRLATEEKRFFLIGLLVDQHFRRLEREFKMMEELKRLGKEPKALSNELIKCRIQPADADALINARTPMSAAKRYVAQWLSRQRHREFSLQTVRSCYSRYLAALKTKGSR